MSYTSPLANPQPYVNKINGLSNEGIVIDKGVANAKRDAADFASKYSSDFSLVTELKSTVEQFSDRWVGALQNTRDAASSISGWYQRFDQVFLSLIDDIETEGDVKDVVTEFNAFKSADRPSKPYDLEKAPGVKAAWNELESLVFGESDYVIQTLQGGDWKKAVAELKKQTPPVKSGINHIRQALNSYATKLE